jgi:hypothetical protein
MAVTSRDLHQQPVRRAVATPRAWPQIRVDRQYIQLALIIVAGYLLLMVVSGHGQILVDDLRYGRPRTTQLSAYVGHNEQAGQPSHFVAMNLNRRVVVIELPGGDSTKAQTLQGPYLFGAKEDLTPVGLRVQDINADSKGDLVIAVKNEEIVYINEGEAFRLITDDERRQLFEAAQ